jgi:hypothetical protein
MVHGFHHALALLTVVPVGLLPVIIFLLLLIYLDTYRMVRMRLVFAMLAAGGVVAIFAVVTQTLAERSVAVRPVHCVPGLLVAIAVHSIFNHFFVSPVLSTIGVLFTLPPLLYLLFHISEHRTHNWLEVDFDEDAELMRMLDSGNFDRTPAGIFLSGLRDKLDGTLLADMLCYLRVYTELALRAKGLLLARENGLDVEMDGETREKFEELRYLEQSIGVAGRVTMRPFLQMTTKDLWQLYVLGK